MKETGSMKIRLLTFFLILAVIVIGVMGYFIYKSSDENKNEENKVSEVNNEVENIESTTNSLQEKNDSVYNMVNLSEINNVSSDSNNFSNNEIKNLLQKYLDLVGRREGSPLGLLVKLDLCDYSDYNNAQKTSDNYVKTNIKYSEYKEKMLNYVTEEWFDEKFTNGYKEDDGVLYYFDGGASGMEFEVKDITKKDDYSDWSYIAEVYNIHFDASKELENIEFHIADNNGKCVISYCD